MIAFTPNRKTEIPNQPEWLTYNSVGSFSLEIPSLNVFTNIVGVPLTEDGWNVQWLFSQAGFLEGTAFPTWEGNTVITSHVFLPSGLPGPFVDLNKLRWGDEIVIHTDGQKYSYQVQTSNYAYPEDLSGLEHKDLDWVTLITCQGYQEGSDTYTFRRVVQAVLVSITSED